MLVSINEGAVSFGANEVFENINFQIKENEKIALIGRNGSGKSTLLNVLLGEVDLTKGQYIKSNKITISSLKQNALINSTKTIRQEFEEVFINLINKEKEIEKLRKKLETDSDPKLIEEYSKLEEEFKLEGGYSYTSEMGIILAGFGFKPSDFDRLVSSFSGGEKTKIAFAKMLLSKPDLLLLDEPTNHLDLKTIEWLENYLVKYKKAIILVSHDRAFIDKIAHNVWEIEYGSIKKYSGNYSAFAEQKKNDFIRQESAYKRQQKDIKRLEDLIEKFRYKANKAAFAQSKIKYLERMDKIEDPKKADTKTFQARFVCNLKGGKTVLSLDHYVCGYDHPLCEITQEIHKGERICVMGDNGTGKSTLLKTIIDEIPALGGYKLFGHQIEIGYFDQNLSNFKKGNTVLEELWNDYPDLNNYEIRSALGAFMFSSDEVFKDVNVLSGGEKVRLLLSKLMLKKANFLILDEPTNNLDIVSKEALENSLKEYDGTILFVSHDRYFIKEIATSCIVIEDGKTTYYPDGYKDYIDINKKFIKEVKKEDDNIKVTLKDKKQKPKHDIKKLETKISELEELLEAKRDLRYDPEYYQDSFKMQELDAEIDEIHNQIHAVTELWEKEMENNDN